MLWSDRDQLTHVLHWGRQKAGMRRVFLTMAMEFCLGCRTQMNSMRTFNDNSSRAGPQVQLTTNTAADNQAMFVSPSAQLHLTQRPQLEFNFSLLPQGLAPCQTLLALICMSLGFADPLPGWCGATRGQLQVAHFSRDNKLRACDSHVNSNPIMQQAQHAMSLPCTSQTALVAKRTTCRGLCS